MKNKPLFHHDWPSEVENMILNEISKGDEQDSKNAVFVVSSTAQPKMAYVLNRFILRLFSPKIAQLLDSGPTLGEAYEINDVSSSEFESMIGYMFTGRHYKATWEDLQNPKSVQEVYSLVSACKKYEMFGFIKQMFEELKNIDLEFVDESIFSSTNEMFQTLLTSVDVSLQTLQASIELHTTDTDEMDSDSDREDRQVEQETLQSNTESTTGNLLEDIELRKIVPKEATDNKDEETRQIPMLPLSNITLVAILGAILAALIFHLMIGSGINKVEEVLFHGKGKGYNSNLLNDLAGMRQKLDGTSDGLKSIQQALLEIKTKLAGINDYNRVEEEKLKSDFRSGGDSNDIAEWKLLLQETQTLMNEKLNFEGADRMACLVLIRNNASNDLEHPVSRHLAPNRVFKRMPRDIDSGESGVFGFTQSADMFEEVINYFEILPKLANGAFGYSIGTTKFIVKYNQQLSGGNSVVIGLLEQNSGFKEEILIQDWSGHSNNVKVFSQALEGHEAIVEFRGVRVRASMTAGNRAALSVLVTNKE